MKFIYCLVIAFWTVIAHAGYQRCPNKWIEHNPHTFNLIKSLSGIHQVGDCKVELRSCDPQDESSLDSQVADLLISYHGQEFYIPLYIDQKSESANSNLSANADQIFYYFNDENVDPYSGADERNLLTINLDFKRTGIEELKMTSKNRHTFFKFLNFKLPTQINCEKKIDLIRM